MGSSKGAWADFHATSPALNQRAVRAATAYPQLPPGSLDADAPAHRRLARRGSNWYAARRADNLYDAQVRLHILRARTTRRLSFRAIAEELGISTSTVRRFYWEAMDRVTDLVPLRRDDDPHDDRDLPPDPRAKRRRGPQPPPHVRPPKTSKAPPPPPGSPFSSSPFEEPPIEGEVLPPPDEVERREQIMQMTKAAIPDVEIAAKLGISVRTVRSVIKDVLLDLEQSETAEAVFERRRMVLQLDEMIRALYPAATGQHPERGRIMPVLEAIDRMTRLLKQKAQLLGLDQPELTDIRTKLALIAEEAGYDIQELEEVARDVLDRHRVRLPGR
jgi:DNA-directed RNA polymerase specialized sigma24 family protein